MMGSAAHDVEEIRKSLASAPHDEKMMNPDPIEQFHRWFEDANSAEVKEPTAMCLSTCTPDGRPSSRFVLLKACNSNGFVFYTNYESRKAHELNLNPYAALVFWWKEIDRSVRIEGTVVKVSEEESEAYFNSRPLGSRIAAWTSRQSQTISSRSELVENYNVMQRKLLMEHDENRGTSKPPFWGGYCVVPTAMEFWQSRTSRLHDRIKYTKRSGGEWTMTRLQP